MSIPPEQAEKLREIFGADRSWLKDDLLTIEDDNKSSVWDVEDKGIDGNLGNHRFELVNGPVSLTMYVYESWSFLNWESDLPDFLQLGTSMDDYRDFIYFAVEDLPSRMFDISESADIGAFDVKAQLGYKRSQAYLECDLNSEKDRVKLITPFLTRPNSISSLQISGEANSIQNSFSYRFNIYYPNNSGLNSTLSIAIPNEVHVVNGWNENTLSWVLSTHAKREKIDDQGVASENLRNLVLPIVEVYINTSNLPQP